MKSYCKLLFFFILLIQFSCKNEEHIKTEKKVLPIEKKAIIDAIELSKTHKINKIKGDIDGDGNIDIVEIVRNTKNNKSGLRISFANGKTDFFGFGKDVLNQDFDEIDWTEIFDIVEKGNTIWSNIDEDGAILLEDEIKEEDKITLKNDGIYLHIEEACGGGIIYYENGKYHWIQQE